MAATCSAVTLAHWPIAILATDKLAKAAGDKSAICKADRTPTCTEVRLAAWAVVMAAN